MVCSKLIGFDMITYFFVNANFNMVGLLGFMVFNATFNNSSVISLGSVLSVEETEIPEKTKYIIWLLRLHICFTSFFCLSTCSNFILKFKC